MRLYLFYATVQKKPKMTKTQIKGVTFYEKKGVFSEKWTPKWEFKSKLESQNREVR